MRVSETQRTGSLAILMISLAVYGVSLLNARQPARGAPIPWGSQGPGLMAVEFSGDRERDGVYFLPEGSNVEKVIHLIGIPDANLRSKTGPIEVSSGSILTVSPRGELSIGKMTAAKQLALGLPVDLNYISEEELSLVPGIGEKTAYKIIELRRELGGFKDLADLTAVPGIKEKKLNALKRYLTVRPAKGEI
jgi:competence protein ComEA